MNNKELFKQAILDAKSVREAALATAKRSLEEQLTPKLQSMLAAKLQEMEDVDEAKEDVNEAENQDLDEVISELENEGSGLSEEELTTEADEEEEEGEDHSPEASASEEEPSPEGPMGGEEEMVSDEDSLKDLTVGNFKNLIRDVVSDVVSTGDMGSEDALSPEDDMNDMGAEPGAEDGGMYSGGGHHEEEDVDEDFNLEELMRELEGLDETEEKLDETTISPKKHGNALKSSPFKTVKSLKEDEYEEEGMDESKYGGKGGSLVKPHAKVNSPQLHETEAQKDLKEAIRTIKTLRRELNEVNLFNAKLLYVNRIFKSKNLTESQKAKVILTIDKANSVKETKLIYETLIGSIKEIKKPITESRSFASKPAGVAKSVKPNTVSTEMDRWQLLAGIKKNKY